MIRAKFFMAAWLLAGLSYSAAAAEPTAPDPTGSAATAARLALAAQRAVPAQDIKPPHFRLSAALLEAAMRLDPAEPRYPRLLVDALLTLRGDRTNDELTAAALAAANAYRKLKPDDHNIEILVIDLHLARMQSSDEKLRYLGELLKDTRIDPEVRSAVAVRAVDLYAARREQPQALAGLREAQKLNPLNLDAIYREYEWLHRSGPPAERLACMLQMIKANPAQYQPLVLIANELCAAGLVDESLVWYEKAMLIARPPGTEAPRDLRLQYACALQIAGRPEGEIWADSVLKEDPGDYTALVLRMLQERRKGNPEAAALFSMRARNSLVNLLAMVRPFDKNAATQPAAEKPLEVPDLSEDAASLARASSELRQQYSRVLSDLTWFELHFNKNAAEGQRLLTALSANLADSDPLLARLSGWLYLLNDKKDEAKVKLSAVAERDPLAAIGLLRIYGDNGDDAAKANALRSASLVPAGLVGVTASEALRERDQRIQPGPNAAALRQELEKFPRDLLRILDLEGAQRFYLLKADPIKTRHLFGEPMFVRITIQNISNFDLVIGRNGVIQPDLWFDALLPQPMAHVCYDRISQQGVLHPRQAITQLVRVDAGDLGRLFDQNPIPVMSVDLRVRLNPRPVVVGDQQGVISTPGGYAVQMGKAMERVGFPVQDETSLRPLQLSMQKGDAAERIRALDCTRALSASFSNPPEKAEPALREAWRGISTRMASDVSRGIDDNDALVRAWSRYFYAALTRDEALKLRMTAQLLGDELWQARLVGLELVRTLSPERQKQLAERVSRADSDPTVRKLASAIVEIAELPPPTTQPATQPAAQPAE